jgi:acyl-coenzyme A synthetase/AMP-(fatty) acid ligase
VPDDVAFVPELPHTATGKILKTKLREMFREAPAQRDTAHSKVG